MIATNKYKLFVDMDGTIATWKSACSLEEILQKNYFRDLPPYQEVVDAIRLIINCVPEIEVFSLSAYMPENEYAVDEKNEWLDEYLPEIKKSNRIFVPCSTSKSDAIGEKFLCIGLNPSFILLDDYSVNLNEWKNAHGLGIKLSNGINGNSGTWKGHSISRFSTAKEIADKICEYVIR